MRIFSLWMAALCLPALAGCGGGGGGNSDNNVRFSTIVGAHYTLTPIPPLSGDDPYLVQATDLNNSGQVIGSSYNPAPGPGGPGPAHPFVFSNGGIHPLPVLPSAASPGTMPEALNDAGTIVGLSVGIPIVWQGGKVQPLSGLSNLTNIQFVAINNKGMILGNAMEGPFVWYNGVVTKLPSLPGTSAVAMALNDAGIAVGYTHATSDQTQKPVVWQNGMVAALLLLPSSPSPAWGSANAINNAGQIAGFVGVWNNGNTVVSHAVVWQNGQIAADLNSILGSGSWEAVGVNNKGAIVINAATPQNHFFLYSNGVLTDFNTLLTSTSGLQFEQVRKINDQGEMLVDCDRTDGGHEWGLLAPNGH